MPGVKIGNGAMISSRSVVVSDDAALRRRWRKSVKVDQTAFRAGVDQCPGEARVVDWPIEKFTEHLELIVSDDVDALLRVGSIP